MRKAAQPQDPVVNDQRPKPVVESEQLRFDMARACKPFLQELPGDGLPRYPEARPGYADGR